MDGENESIFRLNGFFFNDSMHTHIHTTHFIYIILQHWFNLIPASVCVLGFTLPYFDRYDDGIISTYYIMYYDDAHNCPFNVNKFRPHRDILCVYINYNLNQN